MEGTKYTTADMVQRTGATLRQLLWWRKTGVLRPQGGKQGLSLLYTQGQLETAIRMMRLRRAGVSLQDLRRLGKLPEWKRVVTSRLSAVVVGDVLVVFRSRGKT